MPSKVFTLQVRGLNPGGRHVTINFNCGEINLQMFLLE